MIVPPVLMAYWPMLRSKDDSAGRPACWKKYVEYDMNAGQV